MRGPTDHNPKPGTSRRFKIAPINISQETQLKAAVKFHELVTGALSRLEQRVRRTWQTDRGDVTSTVIIIAVLVAAAVAAGVVITTYISGQTSKIT